MLVDILGGFRLYIRNYVDSQRDYVVSVIVSTVLWTSVIVCTGSVIVCTSIAFASKQSRTIYP